MKIAAIPGLLVAGILMLVSCKQTQPDWSSAIVFTPPGPDTVVADGYDSVRVTAHINPNSDPDKRAITFTTDYGTFTSGTASITINADQNGNAATLVKSAVVGIATVRATVETTYIASKTVDFIAPPPSKVFTVNPVAASTPADGVTTVMISAVVNKNLLITTQSVVFTADGGTFGNGTATVTLTADSTGRVAAYLKNTVVGPVHVLLTNNGVTQVVTVNFVTPNPATIFTLNPVSGTAPADGVSTIMISAVVNANLLIRPQTVAFAADGGTFGNGTENVTVSADPNGNVAAYLKSTVAAPVHVALTSNNVTQNVTVTFVQALPDTILLSAAPTLTAGYANTLPISITLARPTGTVSAGLALSYNAMDSSGNTIGVFSNGTLSSATGTASVSFTTGNSPYMGTIYITVSLTQNTKIHTTIPIVVN
jgi:hypothetical protein